MSAEKSKRMVRCQYCIYGNAASIRKIEELAADSQAIVRYPPEIQKRQREETAFWRIFMEGEAELAVPTIRNRVIGLRGKIDSSGEPLEITACFEIYVYTENPQDGVTLQKSLLNVALEVADEVQVAVCRVAEW